MLPTLGEGGGEISHPCTTFIHVFLTKPLNDNTHWVKRNRSRGVAEQPNFLYSPRFCFIPLRHFFFRESRCCYCCCCCWCCYYYYFNCLLMLFMCLYYCCCRFSGLKKRSFVYSCWCLCCCSWCWCFCRCCWCCFVEISETSVWLIKSMINLWSSSFSPSSSSSSSPSPQWGTADWN